MINKILKPFPGSELNENEFESIFGVIESTVYERELIIRWNKSCPEIKSMDVFYYAPLQNYSIKIYKSDGDLEWEIARGEFEKNFFAWANERNFSKNDATLTDVLDFAANYIVDKISPLAIENYDHWRGIDYDFEVVKNNGIVRLKKFELK